jgi:hypothetical protein
MCNCEGEGGRSVQCECGRSVQCEGGLAQGGLALLGVLGNGYKRAGWGEYTGKFGNCRPPPLPTSPRVASGTIGVV